jgi:hypothetical protein
MHEVLSTERWTEQSTGMYNGWRVSTKETCPMFYCVPTLHDSYVVCWSDSVQISVRVPDILRDFSWGSTILLPRIFPTSWVTDKVLKYILCK